MKHRKVGLAVAALAVAGVGFGAYQLGQRDGAQMPAPVMGSNTKLPPDHAALAQGVSMPVVSNSGPFANARFTHFRVGNRNVKSMFADGDVVWIGTSGGVIRYDIKADQYRLFDNHTPGLLSNGIFHINKLGDQMLIGTYGGGLSLYNPTKDKWSNVNIPEGLADQFVYDSLLARNGDLWIATWSGANLIKGARLEDASAWQTFTVENTNGGLPNPWVYGLVEGKSGEMWFATEAGLARYQDGKWQHWQHKDGLGADFEVVKDSITHTNDPGKASSHHAQQKVEQGLQNVSVAYNPNYIISIALDDDGAVWCGTWGGGLARFDGKTWHNYTARDGLPSNHIFMLHQDEAGVLWIGTSKGLARFKPDGKGFDVMTTADGLYADNVFSMASAADGSLWVGSFGGVSRILQKQ